jgi:ribosome-binding factor A
LNEIRQKKIEREIQRTIAGLLLNGSVKDPRVTMATIHRVELAPDMSLATIYYTSYCNNNERKKLSQGLVSAAGYLQSVLGKKLNIRYTPRLKFVWDKEFIKSIEVNQLIDDSAPKKKIVSEEDESDIEEENSGG